MIYTSGLDLGKQNDYSAIAIAEAHGTAIPLRSGRQAEGMPIKELNIRHVERYKLHTPYERVSEATDAWMRSIDSQDRFLAIDHTGVGLGVEESMVKLVRSAYLAWVTLTTGNRATRPGPNVFHVPKKDLVSLAQVALENRVLKISGSLEHGKLIKDELTSYVVRQSANGWQMYEAERQSVHDDIVIAVCLCAWMANWIFRSITDEARELESIIATPPYSISPI